MNISIRYANSDDYHEIIEILNQAIRSKQSTGYLNEFTVNQRKEWFKEHTNEMYPILVAEYENMIIGWISISPYRKGRTAFKKSVEVSFFVHKGYKRRGVGNILLEEMMKVANSLGYHFIFAIVLERNLGSISLLKKHNFDKLGYLPDVADIDGELISHVYYGRKI